MYPKRLSQVNRARYLLRLHEKHFSELKEISRKNGAPVAFLIRQAIGEYLNRHRGRV